MKNCEQYEIELSSVLDGEAAPELAVEAIEHALACESCGEFFRAARRLNAAARSATGQDHGLSDERAEALWREVGVRVQRAVASDSAVRWAGAWASGLRAAALVVLGLGGGYLIAALGAADSTVAGRGATTAVAAATETTSAMNERRFVALADELLSADVRYQRAMLEVLRLVPALETGEGFDGDGETGQFVRASNPNEVRGTGLL